MRVGRRHRRPGALWAFPVAVLAALALAPAATAVTPPWQAAEEVRASLFEAQSALLLGEAAPWAVERARRAYDDALAPSIRKADHSADGAATRALSRAEAAFLGGDEVALAAARGSAVAAIRRGAYEVTLDAVAAGKPGLARRWRQVRDFREATRFTRPGVDATAALDALEAGEIETEEAATQVRKDLLDAYQARLGDFMAEADREAERGFGAALAESAALVNGYWRIVAPEYAEQRGRSAARAAGASFAAIEHSARAEDVAGFRAARRDATEALDGFTAAPFTPEEQARRAAQLTRFLDLVPIEYDDGTDDGHVTIPFELQEAVAFLDGAQSAYDDLEPVLDERDPEASASVEDTFAELRALVVDAHEGREVVSEETVDDVYEGAAGQLDALFPDEWKESSDEADFDLIEISLDQMEAAVSASEPEQAEQARLSAYAFFEFGPEIKLRAFDPQLVADVEGLFWYGARDVDGFAEQIADDRGPREVRETRLVMDEALDEAAALTGDGASEATVITNAATIVFREGLEAILIIAAITASMIGPNRPLRRPVYRGSLLALPASLVLFVLSLFVLDSLSRYGEKLEAVVGIIAVAVLLLVMNWFFHKVYWTEWISGHRKRGLRLAGAGAGAGAVTVAGLYLLGFSSVLREGFETVLFLQALQLSSGTGVVLAGVGLGLLAVAAVGALTFKLEQRLPYKRMLVVTGLMIALVLVVMVGNTVRTLQGVGWLSITPVDLDFPLWMGTWLGVYPTVETLAAQALAFAFVVGSYLAAEWWRKRRLRAAIAAEQSKRDAEQPEAPPPFRTIPLHDPHRSERISPSGRRDRDSVQRFVPFTESSGRRRGQR
jgi:high-affinity iron transporter